MVLDDGPERRPQTIGGGVYLVVVGAALTGLAIAVAGAWRTGVVWMGVGLLVGGSARLVLPERQAGMMRVRRKASDVVMLLGVGIALIVLAIVVPDQPS